MTLKHYLVSLKVDVAQVQYGRKNSKDGRLIVRSEVEDLHGSKQTQEVLRIILSCYPTIPSLYGERERERESTSRRGLFLHRPFLQSPEKTDDHVFLPG